jgi:hypothetical protein
VRGRLQAEQEGAPDDDYVRRRIVVVGDRDAGQVFPDIAAVEQGAPGAAGTAPGIGRQETVSTPSMSIRAARTGATPKR